MTQALKIPFVPSVSPFSSPSLSLSLRLKASPLSTTPFSHHRSGPDPIVQWTAHISTPRPGVYVWACGPEPVGRSGGWDGGVEGVEELFYVAVWEVREIIDCYNWCPLISWQRC